MAIALGLFPKDGEAQFAMREAVHSSYTPSQLRFLFATVLIHMPGDSRALYDEFLTYLSWDLQAVPELANGGWLNVLLQSIEGYLSSQGSSLAHFKLPLPSFRTSELDYEAAAFYGKTVEMQEFVRQTRAQFNNEQAQVYAKLEAVVQGGEGLQHLHFLDGKVGGGKTFLMNCLVTQFRAEGNLVLVVGTTGLSIVYYERGRTAHSAFGIPVKEGNFDLTCTIHPSSSRAKLICAAKFIVWEELPMTNKAAFEAVDSLFRSLTASPLPFGGKILMTVGDFRQVAPVVKGGGLSAAIDASVRMSHLWPTFQIHCLTQPMCNAQDPEFCKYADSIGEDTEGSRDITLLHLP